MQFTQYSDINELLELFLRKVKTVLGKKFIGLYLYGSLATGDFDTKSSDIDFLVATSDELDSEEVKRLKKMHEEVAATGGKWGKKVEGAYISKSALRRYNPDYRQPFLSTITPFGIINLDLDWVINRYVLREEGVVVYGPSTKNLIDPVSSQQVTNAVRDLLCKSWSKHVDGPEWMRSRFYQAFTILTMCRALYVLEHGDIVSKQKATFWAEKNLDPEWTRLVRWALSKRYDKKKDSTTLKKTLEFLRFVIESNCNSLKNPRKKS